MNYKEQEYRFDKIIFKSIFILPVFIGAMFMYGSLKELKTRNYLLESGIHTFGVVKYVENINSIDEDFTKYYIDFTNEKGEVFHTENNFGTKDSRYRINDKVKIIYNSENPKVNIVDDKIEVTGTKAFTIIGFILIILGLLGLKYAKLSKEVVYE